MGSENNELIGEFIAESEEYLAVLNQKLLKAEDAIKSGVDMSAEELNAMFRSVHTIKGTASFFDLQKIVHLTHDMEAVLSRIKKFEMKLTAPIIDVLFGAFDTLQKLVTNLKEQGSLDSVDIKKNIQEIALILDEKPVEPSIKGTQPSLGSNQPVLPVVAAGTVIPAAVSIPPAAVQVPKGEQDFGVMEINDRFMEAFVSDIEDNVENFNNDLIKLEQTGNLDLVGNLFRYAHTVKGSSGVVNCQPMTEVSHKMESILSVFREQKKTIDTDTVTLLLDGIDTVKFILNAIKKQTHLVLDLQAITDKLDQQYKKLINPGI
ncbi:MAG: Hpt domain-containing protein [Candidatus Omnitrophica bacterium]|nr:Hpt domain-containing protein [Candidatus Omnitrophota bacterium]